MGSDTQKTKDSDDISMESIEAGDEQTQNQDNEKEEFVCVHLITDNNQKAGGELRKSNETFHGETHEQDVLEIGVNNQEQLRTNTHEGFIIVNIGLNVQSNDLAIECKDDGDMTMDDVEVLGRKSDYRVEAPTFSINMT